MSIPLRIVPLFVNCNKSVEVGSTNITVQNATRLFARESVLLQIVLFDNAGAAYALPNGLTYKLGLDSVFTADHADPAVALHDDFNIDGDWAEAAPSAGKLSVRLSLNTTEMVSGMGAVQEVKHWMCVWATPEGGDPMLVFQIPIMVHNVAVTPTGATPTGLETYLTADMLLPLLNIHPGFRLKIDADGQIMKEDVP